MKLSSGGLEPIFAALAPGIEEAPRTPGREKVGGTAEHVYLHCGPSGAGHFVKMVHNGIEYGMMASYAEGLNILHHANIGKQKSTVDAETTPLRDPEHYAYDLNLADITEVWRRSSIIRLLAVGSGRDFPARQLRTGEVYRPGLGLTGKERWMIKAMIDESVPAPVLSAALYERFSSRDENDFADKLLSDSVKIRMMRPRNLCGNPGHPHADLTPLTNSGLDSRRSAPGLSSMQPH